MRRRPIFLLMVFLTLVVLLIGSRIGDPQRDAIATPQPDTASRKARVQATAPEVIDPAAQTSALLEQLANGDASALTTPAPAATLAPLPAWDAKLVDVLPELRARADAGDVQAACHLSLALSACANVAAWQPSPAELRTLDPNDQNALNSAAFRSNDMHRAGREATCVGLDPEQLSLRFDYLQRAADAGNAAAMIAYAEGVPVFSLESMVRHADWLEDYRLRAPRYVADLLRRGDRHVAFLLYLNADGMRTSLMAQALALDELSSATFWHLGRIILSQPDNALESLSAEADSTARHRARAIYGQYFDSRPHVSGEFVERQDLMRVENCTEAR